ncbi:acetylxylan esterase [Bryobacter aggregatus]|uniref:alpha/beta hydrolase n=1 Tax=Bryobacter aggregatus TaxID=360054 RepID=UPI0004E20C48|nr:acetylxylan esterase [Bryobacter aggregatus]
MKQSVLCLILFLLASGLYAQDRDLQFLTNHTDYRELRNQLANLERNRALSLLEQRKQRVAQWTLADVQSRKAYVRERLTRALGGFPERTPLHAKVTGVIEHDDYRIEKIVFESQPRFFVTANLYVPKKGKGPYPAILFPLGHEPGAKSNDVWQQILGTFARKGYVCLAWEMVGQGERVQLYNRDTKQSQGVAATTEHVLLGTQTLLTGNPLARYTIWDGIRALDYLVSRSEVDPKRIGVTGNSGGGTHTAYLAALDDRIQVAAPSCYITSFSRLLRSIGPQDAEQVIPPMIADGLDFGDYLHSFAPKPYLVLSAIQDFFSISGARETFAEAKRVYELYGASDKLAMTEADDGHGYTSPRRLAAYRWFDKWLKGVEETTPDSPVTVHLEEELWGTATGQVQTSLDGETVTSLNLARARSLPRSKPSASLVRNLIGYEPANGAPIAKPFGTLQRDGYRIEKLVYESEPGIEIPALLFLPQGGAARKAAVLFANGQGKAADTKEIESLLRQGLIVLSIDARGFGETRDPHAEGSSDWTRYFGDYNNAMTALLSGKTLVGSRAADISRGVSLLAARPDVDPQRIYGVGKQAGGVPMLHAAVLDPRLRRVVLDETLQSYLAVVEQPMHKRVVEQVIPGVLSHYDLPELVSAMAPRSVVIVDATDPLGFASPLALVKAAYPQSVVLRRHPGDSAATLYGFDRP